MERSYLIVANCLYILNRKFPIDFNASNSICSAPQRIGDSAAVLRAVGGIHTGSQGVAEDPVSEAGEGEALHPVVTLTEVLGAAGGGQCSVSMALTQCSTVWDRESVTQKYIR